MKHLLIILTLTSLSLTACFETSLTEVESPSAAEAEHALTTPAIQPTATPEQIDPTVQATLVAEKIEPETQAPVSEETETTLPPSETIPFFRAAECPFEMDIDLDVDCGYLTVLENRAKSNSPTIELAVAILRAAAADVRPDPIVYLAGGPGGSALVDFESEPDSWADYPFSQQRDLIFIDQRGTGYSIPNLNCIEVETAGEEAEQPELACRDRLIAAGIDLTAYNTTENAADIAALMQALNYDTWNILGVSYGTRLGLAVMRDHPQDIRSVALDSPFPPNAATPEEESINSMEALRLLFADCAADPYCDETFPDLATVLEETVIRLNDDPDAYIYGDDLLGVIEQAMTAGSDFIYLLPLMIYDVAEDNFELYEEIAAEVGAGDASARFQGDIEDRSDSEGMYNSVICRDEFTFGDYEVAEQKALSEIPEAFQEVLFGSTAELFEVCEAWGAGAAAPLENQAVVSDIPTLILVGQYDPTTPPKWGKLTAATLSHAYYFEFRGAGHSLLSSNECAITVTEAFFDNPATEPGRRCLEAISGPEFATE